LPQLLGLLDNGGRNGAKGAAVPRTMGGDVGGVMVIMSNLGDKTGVELET